MKKRTCVVSTVLALIFCVIALGALALAEKSESRRGASKDSAGVPVVRVNDADSMRTQGEQRFHANCGRCHVAPQKFPARMMKTIVRHMRVRATITDDDMRMILFYMTQ